MLENGIETEKDLIIVLKEEIGDLLAIYIISTPIKQQLISRSIKRKKKQIDEANDRIAQLQQQLSKL